MTVAADIVIPRENANDDVVRVVRWLAASGTLVERGAAVVEIETSKSVVEVVAPSAGRLAILADAGADVPVGSAIGRVEPVGATAARNGVATAALANGAGTVAAPHGSPVISRRARERLALHGLDEAAVAHLAIVRECDVDDLLAARQPGPAAAHDPSGRAHAAPGRVDAAAGRDTSYAPRGLLGDARRSAADRGLGFFALLWNYLWRNWLLGNLVRVAPVGIRNVLHRWRGVRMGRDCFIDPNAILETAYPENITLGDDVRVTAGAIVMTHIKAPHLLRDRGYVPVVLRPVVLSSHCFIGVNAVVMPGVTVGEGAVVTSGSVVLADVPPFTVVSGNPARIVKTFGDA
jgi:acetyltransferase-like isoleucine patch superfamily enzyme